MGSSERKILAKSGASEGSEAFELCQKPGKTHEHQGPIYLPLALPLPC